MSRYFVALVLCATFVSFAGFSHALPQADEETASPAEPTKLTVLWTSGDPDVAHRVALMDTHAAQQRGWFEEVRLIVWGPSQRILVGDKDLKEKLAAMREDGVVVEACIACANSFGVADQLRALELPVKPMGSPLTEYLKDPEYSVITF
jgi:hypothetical protein